MDNFANNSKQESNVCVAYSQSGDDSLQWVKLSLNGVAVYPKKKKEKRKKSYLTPPSYAQFLPNATVDGRSRVIKFSINANDNSVAATLPHFWDNSEIDPIYSVLISPETKGDNCNDSITTKKSKHWRTVTIAVTVSIVGAAILLAAAYLVYSIQKRKRSRARLHDIRMSSKN